MQIMAPEADMKTFFRTHKWIRVLAWAALAAAAAALALVLFVALWPPFSGRISRPDRVIYTARAINYDGEHFFNAESPASGSWSDPGASLTSGRGTAPQGELPAGSPDFSAATEDGLSFTWLGHSTTLVQMEGLNILFDPVLSTLVSPVSFLGPRRFGAPPVTAQELPEIDAVIISHDHYDHLDMETIKAIDGKVKLYIVPLGIENDLRRWGVDGAKIRALAWWEELDLGGVTVVCAPARHSSGRNVIDENRTLWASWALLGEHFQVYESGSTGFGQHFQEIHNRYGDFDLALMECGQYSADNHDIQMIPEEAVEAAEILGADAAVPIHWGVFALSDHAWDDPPRRFTLRAGETGLTALTPLPGETVNWEDALLSQAGQYQSHWWE